MGVGKTTIGELVAKKLYREFIDIDKEIEKEFNMPIPEIFKTFGEETFREKEKEIITAFSKKRLKVISVGGGAFGQEEIKNICMTNGIVFLLDLSWDCWKERLDLIIDNRPVLQGRTLEEIEELYYQRQKIYSTHNSRFNTDNIEAEEISDYIIDTLKLSWDIHEPHSGKILEI
ncbi:shikimate kinase [Scopulibacillus cellulosilyticus]|uniref:Shikimate kinase n=1 Tax=Scopulibacillus cellulosilyticus TaxID=2665665 RepID=A0ABW2PX68_9BACL